MPVVTSSLLIGGAIGAAFGGVGGMLVGGGLAAAAGYGIQSQFVKKDFLGDIVPGTLKQKVPEAATPPPTIQAGSEGVRQGAVMRESQKRAITSLYLTRNQTRAEDATLGGYTKTLA